MTNEETPQQNTIIRAPHDRENPYFMHTRTSAQDENLSYEARGLLAYLLSKPSDWRINVSDIENGHCGRDKARRILKELIQHRYMTAPERYQNDKGQWRWTPYQLFETPYPFTENPSTDNQSTDKPLSENTSSYIVETKQNKETKKDSTTATQDASAPTKKQRHNAMCEAIIAAMEWDRALIAKGQWGSIHESAKQLVDIGVAPDEVIWLKRECDARQYRGYGAPALPKVAVDVLPRIRSQQANTIHPTVLTDEQPEPPTLTELMRNAGYEVSS